MIIEMILIFSINDHDLYPSMHEMLKKLLEWGAEIEVNAKLENSGGLCRQSAFSCRSVDLAVTSILNDRSPPD